MLRVSSDIGDKSVDYLVGVSVFPGDCCVLVLELGLEVLDDGVPLLQHGVQLLHGVVVGTLGVLLDFLLPLDLDVLGLLCETQGGQGLHEVESGGRDGADDDGVAVVPFQTLLQNTGQFAVSVRNVDAVAVG